MELLISWLTLAFGFWLAGRLIDGFHVGDFKQAVLVAAVFAVLHFLVGWIFVGLLTIGTLGLPWLLGLGFLVRWAVSTIVLKITDAVLNQHEVRRKLILSNVPPGLVHVLRPAPAGAA